MPYQKTHRQRDRQGVENCLSSTLIGLYHGLVGQKYRRQSDLAHRDRLVGQANHQNPSLILRLLNQRPKYYKLTNAKNI